MTFGNFMTKIQIKDNPEYSANAHILIVSLRQWCKDNGVKIRLTHKNHIVLQERKEWSPPDPSPEEKILVQDLIFIDRSTSIFEYEKCK